MQDMCTRLTMALHILIWQTIMDLVYGAVQKISSWEGIEMNLKAGYDIETLRQLVVKSTWWPAWIRA